MKIGVIGTGNMGGALMDAFCKDAENTMVACNHGKEKLEAVCKRTGTVPAASAAEVAQNCDLLMLAVKPIVMPEILREIAPVVTKDQIIVSIAVGLTIQSYLDVLGEDKKVVRAMPNTPAADGAQAGPVYVPVSLHDAFHLLHTAESGRIS